MHQCLQDQNSIDFRVPIIYRVCPQFNLLSVGRLVSTWEILLPLNCSLNIPIFASPDIYKHGLNVTLKAVTEQQLRFLNGSFTFEKVKMRLSSRSIKKKSKTTEKKSIDAENIHIKKTLHLHLLWNINVLIFTFSGKLGAAKFYLVFQQSLLPWMKPYNWVLTDFL